MDDAELIAEVGQALWGPAWKGPMAEAVRHHKNAVGDWASGRLRVPAAGPESPRRGSTADRRADEGREAKFLSLHSAAFGIAVCCMRKTCSQPR